MNNINLGGRPRKFKTSEELKELMENYFNNTNREEWTVTGLSLLVGSKQLLNDYEKRDEFKEIITEAKLLVENGYELDLKKHGRTGTIFGLKNFGWKDKTESDVTVRTPKPLLDGTDVHSNNGNQEAGEAE